MGFSLTEIHNRIKRVEVASARSKFQRFCSRRNTSLRFSTIHHIIFLQASRQMKFSSEIDDGMLYELKHLRVEQGRSYVHFQVLAVARYAGV